MNFLTVLLMLLSIFFVACKAQDSSSNFEDEVEILEDVNLVDVMESSQGSGVTLFKLKHKCLLSYNLYGEIGQDEYLFYFYKNQLLEGKYNSYRYKVDEEGIIDLANFSETDIVLVKQENIGRERFDKLIKLLNPDIVEKIVISMTLCVVRGM
ncbi:MAG: hypothetical protein Q4F77_00595 [Acinetobacter sp.]|uniref:hypothetical protein n=1 Tax=Acinetobacter sp. TaxID=472 RepID=UPI0026E0A0EF|nr:hypothetical protein [Acinetobacter sp.]MDO5541781.1 hypothetical protein [Acinetobacter sp.]